MLTFEFIGGQTFQIWRGFLGVITRDVFLGSPFVTVFNRASRPCTIFRFSSQIYTDLYIYLLSNHSIKNQPMVKIG